ncbi:MAG TPA: CPBP family glutamic-type intramembrane protease [Ilumatobacteraceae bacterium]|nr:CPBP family glutamic-type intramembrane protease [Ilumatobacteraceae bacterium]
MITAPTLTTMFPTPAGWFPDPWNSAAVRFWDGRSWTTHTAWPGPEPTPPHPNLPIRAAWGAVITLMVSVIASRYLLEAISGFDWPIAVYVAITAVVGYGPALLWCWYASREWGTGRFRTDVGFSAHWADVGWGPLTWVACVMAEIAIGVIVVALKIPFTSNVKDVSDLHADRGYVISLLVLAVVAAPIAEEIVFRGVVMRGLLSRSRVVIAVGLQAVLFGMAHFDPVRGMGNVGLIMVLSSVGAVLGGAAFLVRRLAPTMIAHAILNGVAMAIALSGWSPNR